MRLDGVCALTMAGGRHMRALCRAQRTKSKSLQMLFDPCFTVERPFAEQEGASVSPEPGLNSSAFISAGNAGRISSAGPGLAAA